MSASVARVICFETFRLERDRRRGEGPADTDATPNRVPFLREAGVPLTARQIAHRQTMLDYWNQRRRAMFGLFREVAVRGEATGCE